MVITAVLIGACESSGDQVDVAWCDLPSHVGSIELDTRIDGVDAPCVIELIETGVILRSDSVDPKPPLVLKADGRFVTLSYHPGKLAVWRTDGTFEAFVGNPGEGPGEFAGYVDVMYIDRTDSIHAVDEHRRWSVIAPSLVVARQAAGIGHFLSNINGTLFLPEGTVIVAQPLPEIPDPRPLYLIDRSGHVLDSFGAVTGQESEPSSSGWIVGSSTQGFWSVDQSRYRLELRDSTRSVVRTIQRILPSFEVARPSSPQPGRAALLPSRVIALREDQDGLLWTVVMEPGADHGGAMPLGLDDIDRYYDFRVEVLDPVSATLVASNSYDRQSDVPFFTTRGTAYRSVISDSGAEIRVVTPRLARRGRAH